MSSTKKPQVLEIEDLNNQLGAALRFEILPHLIIGGQPIMRDHALHRCSHAYVSSMHPGCLSEKGPYKDVSELARFHALVLLPHDVTAFFWMEAYALAIPTFVPSPRLLAEWEAEYDMCNFACNQRTHA